jgi:hypothetical protein
MAEESDEPQASKLTRTKQRWARERRFLTGKTSSGFSVAASFETALCASAG